MAPLVRLAPSDPDKKFRGQTPHAYRARNRRISLSKQSDTSPDFRILTLVTSLVYQEVAEQ